jgi:uncharacterized protein YggE
MRFHSPAFIIAAAMLAGTTLYAQFPGQVELKVEPSNRTLSVNAEAQVTADPDTAILHIGFETNPSDAQSAYAEGAQTSNAIISAVKQAGVPENAIHSETQHLDRDYTVPKSHKFKLVQQWTVKTDPAHVAQVLDAAVTAGASVSGDIEWTVKDPAALDAQALENAAARAKDDAAVLAKGMGVRLGALVYVSKTSEPQVRPMPGRVMAMAKIGNDQPLAIEPGKVTRSATVYAVYAIE